MNPKVSVIIPCHAVSYGLENVLESLREQTYKGQWEVIVANDGNLESIKTVTERYGAIAVPSVPGGNSYRARNAALSVATGSIIAFTDANKVPARNWIEKGCNAIAHAGASYVAGRIILSPRPDHVSWLAYWYQVYRAFPAEHYLRKRQFAVTGNLFAERYVLDQVGVFAEGAVSGGDLEWGQRVHKAGIRQIYEELAIVTTEPRSFGDLMTKAIRTQEGILALRVQAVGSVRRAITLRMLGATLFSGFPICLNKVESADRPWSRDLAVAALHFYVNFQKCLFLASSWATGRIREQTHY